MKYSESETKAKLFLAETLKFSEKKMKILECFVKEVLIYNKKYNLISRGSEKEIWNRHILDCAQLIKNIDYKNCNTLSDIGTGAGFPGIILGIYYSDILTFHVKLYEKSRVKVIFIKSIIKKFGLNNVSIYDNDYQSHKIDADYIVCRAFKKLPEILRISREIVTKPHKFIIMLGKSAQDEINKASKGMIYKYKLIPSITSKDSKILLVEAEK